jgi:hypothetical protein
MVRSAAQTDTLPSSGHGNAAEFPVCLQVPDPITTGVAVRHWLGAGSQPRLAGHGQLHLGAPVLRQFRAGPKSSERVGSL